MKRKYLFLTIVLNFAFFFSYSQQDCTSAIQVCTETNSGGVVSGYGVDDFNGATVSGCLAQKYSSETIENNSYWFRIKIAKSGEFGFVIEPINFGEDWDFAVYGPDADCGELGDPVKCNFDLDNGYTGVGDHPTGGGSNFDSWMDVSAGDIYYVLVNQYEGDNGGFKITWTGDVIETHSDPLDCSLDVVIGGKRTLCEGERPLLRSFVYGSSDVNYLWYFENSSGVYELFSPSRVSEDIFVTESGKYRLEVIDPVTLETASDEFEINFYEIPVIEEEFKGISLYSCDDDGNGEAEFDLSDYKADLIGTETNLEVSFHLLEGFVDSGADEQPVNITSGNSTVWAKLFNVNNPECYDYTSVELILIEPVTPVAPPPLSVCDIDGDGFHLFNLTDQIPIILNGGNSVVNFHETMEDAERGKPVIEDPDNYFSDTKTIWASVGTNPDTPCFEITSFDLFVYVEPYSNRPEDIRTCDDDNDGIGIFDFNDLLDLDILGGQNPAEFDVHYYLLEEDAIAGDIDEKIEMPYQTLNPYNNEQIFARVQPKNLEASSCYSLTSFFVQVLDLPLPTSSVDMTTLSYCDDDLDGDDTNGLYNFDLTEKATEILNGQSPFVFTIEYYEDPDYLMQIPDPTNYVNKTPGGETVYIRVLNGNPNNVSCIAETSFFVEVRPLPRAIDTTFTLIQCDEDASPDGIANFILSEADDFIRLGDEALEVSYHLSSSDATTGINSLDKSSFSNSVASAVYARVLAPNGCHRIVDVSLETSITNFPPNYLRRFVSCDTDDISDGKSVFDLTSATSEIISLFNSQNLRISFYRNEDDALSEVNQIVEPTLYENEVEFFQIIWVRVESALDGGCFGVGPVVELVINRRPNFELIESAFVCLNNTPLNVTVENPEGIYNYSWTNQSGEVISLVENVQIYEAGVYTVIATSVAGCDSFPHQIEITASEIPRFTSDDITVVENSEINSITIRNDGQNLGVGDYEFSLDDPDGFYQDDNVFYNVIPGRHTVYVRDRNGCGIAQQVVNILGFPKFFTPNEDGINDYWNVLGINSTDYPEVVVYIFDRHGKHLTTIDGNSIGWNGIYNGSKSISSDYWYLAELKDSGGNLSQYKGHFSLIRR